MTLVGPQTYVLRPSPNGTTGPNSAGAKLIGTTYIFDVAAGSYTLTTTKTDFFQQQLVALPLTPVGTMLAGQNVAIKKQAVVTAKALNRGLTVPADLRIDLLNTVNNSTYGPTAVPATPTTNPTVSFNVPDGTYRARTFSATYPQQTSSPDASVGIGATPSPLDITLPRITRFNVSGPSNATATISGVPKSAASGTTIEFSDTTTTGTLQATVSATNYRTQVVTVPAELFTTTPITLLPNVTVTGTIVAGDEALSSGRLKATSGTTELPGSITSNIYRVEGLTANADGSARNWVVSYDKPGVGQGSATTISVSGAAPVAGPGGTVPGTEITLTKRGINYDFTVTSGGPTPVVGATITLDTTPLTAPPDTDVNGTSRAVVNENVAFNWVIKKTGFLTRYGPAGPATSLTNVSIPVTMVAGVSGLVTDAGSPVPSATVVVCTFQATPTSACVPTAARTFTTDGTGTYKITSDLLAGQYTVWASTTGPQAKTGSTTLTINANGDAQPLATIAIT